MLRVRVALCGLVAMVAAGCVREPEPIRVVTRTVVKEVERKTPTPVAACPSDAEIADGVVVAFVDIYSKVPGRPGTCPCPDSTYVHYGKVRSCSSPGAIKPAEWGYCSSQAVPATLIADIKARISAC